MKTIHLMAGLPRSGSTVIASILNQNPQVYVTPTSPMLNVAVKMQEAWATDPTVQANLEHLEPQINNLTKAILPAFWEHRPENIIIDKGRGWAKNIPTVNQLFGYKTKVIVNTRDLPSIMASWMTLIRNQPDNCYIKRQIRNKGFEPTDENLMAEMWFNMVKDCMEGLKQIRTDAPNQILEVNYDTFIKSPKETIESISDFLSLPKFEYDFNNIINDTKDDDLVAWGFSGLHTIRDSVKKTCSDPREILGDVLYDRFVELEKQYV